MFVVVDYPEFPCKKHGYPVRNDIKTPGGEKRFWATWGKREAWPS